MKHIAIRKNLPEIFIQNIYIYIDIYTKTKNNIYKHILLFIQKNHVLFSFTYYFINLLIHLMFDFFIQLF